MAIIVKLVLSKKPYKKLFRMDSIESESQSESSQTSIKDEKDEVPEDKPKPRRSTRKKLNKVRCSTDDNFTITFSLL